MIITNTKPRLIHMPSIEGVGSVQLAPGKNSVGDSYWQKVKDNRKVRAWLADGTLTQGVVTVPETPKAPIAEPVVGKTEPEEDEVKTEPADENALADLSVPDAKEVVENESDIDTLQSWLLAEKRSTLKTFLAARIKAVRTEQG